MASDGQEFVQTKSNVWHLDLAEHLRRTNLETVYPSQARHPELFQPEEAGNWIVPELHRVLSVWRETRDPGTIDLENLPGVRLEMEGVLSFDCLTPEYCNLLLAEVQHYQLSGLPQKAPNSMNNYGLVLNEIGMRPALSTLLKDFLHGIAARMFGADSVRQPFLNHQDLGTEDWGGSDLSFHHSFVVQYHPEKDKHLDMHVDECDVTFNFGLTDSAAFEGSDLAFCGMLGSPAHRKHVATYSHVKGRCVVHAGKRRHGALEIQQGDRASLIMWTKSEQFRKTPEYRAKLKRVAELGSPDKICLSYTHDHDYVKLMSNPGMKIIIEDKIPGVLTTIYVDPDFLVKDVAEILCYGISRRGGSWDQWQQYGGTPPLAALMRFSFGKHLELSFERTLRSYGIGPGDTVRYGKRVVRTSAVFAKSWDRLNGACTYFPTRTPIPSSSTTGLELRLLARKLACSDGQNYPLEHMILVSMHTEAPISDEIKISSLLDEGDHLLRVRVEVSNWGRRRSAWLIAVKGQPLLMLGGSFTLALEFKLLLFIQLHRSEHLFKKIVSFL